MGSLLRYAMKANPSLGSYLLFSILDFTSTSSDFEVERALRAGFALTVSS
jgi:diaminopimelate decarboxylase